jgi:type I restriction enzyme R subunit
MDESEWLTRKTRIDSKLRSLDPKWEIIRYSEGMDLVNLTRHAVEEFPTDNGPADYALFVQGKLLGIIEAKKVGVGPQNVLEQAKRYAAGASQGPGNWDGLRVPFLYATNGEIIWHLDARNKKRISRTISNFHTATALDGLFATDLRPAHKWLLDNSSEQIERLRPYQKEAITKIEAALIDGKRQLLVAMATGTGKTYMTVAQIYRLLEAKFARRILFLVDRKALAAQAVREFASFNTPRGNKFNQEYEVYSQRFRKEDFGDDKPFDPKILPSEYLTNPSNAHTFVYVSTIQRMAINLFGRENVSFHESDYDDEADKQNIPIHALDVIIADECHRGYTAQETSIWRDTINHFDAIKIGLTATPAAHPVSLFGEPVFHYGVEQAIREGYLADYESVIIDSIVRMNGVFLREGEHVGKIDTDTGEEVLDELEDERAFPSQEVEEKITVPDSNRKIIKEIAWYACQHEKETGRFPKTLIFAVHDLPHTSHADQLVRVCREVFDRGDEFVQKITGSANVDRPLQRIREFRNRPNPKVVVTVDMLTTGVDIPWLGFLVFLRPVKSRILWEQMLGRGTRLCPEINKTHFTIFDCFDGTLITYFAKASNFKIEPPRKEPVPLEQVIDNIYRNVDRSYNVGVLVKRLRRIEKDMSSDKRVIAMIDEEDWSSMGIDVKGAAFEGLLERAASEGKKGAGQYFTPRALIQSIVRLMKPDPRGKPEFKICDPACGTGGFLVAAYEWLVDISKGVLDRNEVKRIKTETYYGQDLVPRPRRLALMNLFLHGVAPRIYLGDTIYEPDRGERYNVVLTNPPFGTKGANQAPEREDFTIETSNKQLNFVQHVMTTLKPGGRAAIVLPDNCLFEGKAGEVVELLMQDCNLHTILRLPRGTFTPYSQGVKANVIFFQKGYPTEHTWIFDARSNVPGITKKDRPLTPQHFAEFEQCYGNDPNGLSKRIDMGDEGRFRRYHISEIKEQDYKLDITWLKDDSLEDTDELPEPQDLVAEAIMELEAVVDDLKEIVILLGVGDA